MNISFDIRGSQTEQNLAIAFVGESQARTRYLFYSERAKDENYPTLANIFLETADNERGHAEIFYDYLSLSSNGKTLVPHTMVPIELGNTVQNLEAAANGEKFEYSELYRDFAIVAEEEGFYEIAETFRKVVTIEKWHHDRYIRLLNRLSLDMLYDLPTETIWVCTNCGLHVEGASAPTECPMCHHPKYYFMEFSDEISPVEPSN